MDNYQKEIVFEANRKSKGIAYLLWLFLGWFGAHRFYAGETKTAIIQLVLTLTGVGVLINIPWLLADLFLIPGMVNDRNLELIHALNSDAPRGYTSELGDDRLRDDHLRDDRGLEDRIEEYPELRDEPVHELSPKLDGKRARMLEDLRATGYRKKRRDFSNLYR